MTYKVVIVDANLQFGDVAVFLNLQGKYSLVNLAERADELEEDFIQSVVTTHSSGVKVLLCPPTPEDAELVGGEQLKKVIEALSEHFHYVLVDTPAVLRNVELSIFDASDRVLLVATPDIPSLANIKKFFDLTEKLEYPGRPHDAGAQPGGPAGRHHRRQCRGNAQAYGRPPKS